MESTGFEALLAALIYSSLQPPTKIKKRGIHVVLRTARSQYQRRDSKSPFVLEFLQQQY